MAARTPSAALGGDVIIYGLGSAVVALMNFLFFAVYARVLLPADYGAMSLIVTVCSGVSMLGMMGMNNAVQRFFFDEKSDAAQRRVWGSGFVGGLAFTTTFAALAVVAFFFIGNRQPALAGPAALVAVATVVPQTVVVWIQDRARLQFRAWSNVALALAQAIVAGGAGVYFVAYLQRGLTGFFAGAAIGAIFTVLLGVVAVRGLRPVIFSRDEFRRLLRFGAPFVPTGVAIWSCSTVLRWELVHFKNLEAAGIFDVAWKLAAPVWMLNAAVGQAFGPYAFRLRAEDPEYRSKLVDLFHLIGALTLCAACALALFAHELCSWIAPAAYAGVALPCAILTLAFYFSALHQVTALGIAFGEKPRLIAIGWSGAAIASFLLAAALAPAFGAAGAAWCVVSVYGGLNVFYAFHSQRLHPLPFRVGPVAVQVTVLLLAVGVAAATDRREVSLSGMAVKLLCYVVLMAGVVAGGGINVPRIRGVVAGLLPFRKGGR